MASLHTYRRGHVFWWRRIHPISGGRKLDIRLSLKTFDRMEASRRGAALTTASGGVIEMLNQHVGADRSLTEAELQAMAEADEVREASILSGTEALLPPVAC